MGEDLPEGSEGCNLDVYHVCAEVPVLLARLPILLRFIPNIPRHLVNLAEVDEIKVSAEPNAESPIFLMIGWAYRAVLEVHGRMESRRDRLFVSRGPLLAAAQRQLEALASGFAFPILLDEFSPSPSPMFTTLNNSSMHVSHRSRCIGLACQHVLGGLVRINNQPHPAVGPRDSVIPDGTILTITQVLPARHLHDLKHHPQRQKWLGLAESSSLEGSSAMMPIPADVRHASQETARTDSPHPLELDGGSIADDRAASPSDYLALCRHIDLSGILDTRDNDEDLAMDDDRLVIRYVSEPSAITLHAELDRTRDVVLASQWLCCQCKVRDEGVCIQYLQLDYMEPSALDTSLVHPSLYLSTLSVLWYSLCELADQTCATTHEFHKPLDILPPDVGSSTALHVGVFHDLGHSQVLQVATANGDHGGRLCRVRALATERSGVRHRVFLEELHALVRQPGGTGTVQRGWNTTLQGMTERSGTGVEKLLALLLEDLGDDIGRVD